MINQQKWGWQKQDITKKTTLGQCCMDPKCYKTQKKQCYTWRKSYGRKLQSSSTQPTLQTKPLVSRVSAIEELGSLYDQMLKVKSGQASQVDKDIMKFMDKYTKSKSFTQMSEVVKKWRNRGQKKGRIPESLFDLLDKNADRLVEIREWDMTLSRGDFDKNKKLTP